MIFFLANKLLKLLSRISAKKGYEYLSEMSDADAVRNVDYLSHALRSVRKRGAGVTLAPIRLALRECAVVAGRKVRDGQPLFGFEKWLRDHERTIFAALAAVRDLSDLPHANGLPRVVILADFIVRYTGGKVTTDKVRKVLSAFTSVTPLTYAELVALPSALRYRLLFEISLLAERSVHYYTQALRARRGRFRAKCAISDAYLYAFVKCRGEEAYRAAFPERSPSSVILGFENVLADDEVLASSYVGSLREIPHLEDKGEIVSHTASNAVFLSSDSYRDMSATAKAMYAERCGQLASSLSVSESALARAVMHLGDVHGLHFGEILFYYPKAIARYLKKGISGPLGNEKKKVQGGYAAAVLFLSLIVAVVPAYLLRNVWAYLSVLPLFLAALHPVEYLLKRILSARMTAKPVPQMDHAVLPERARTVVVVSRFVSKEEDAVAALEQAETLAAGERDPAVSVVVLVDLPSSSEAWSETDETIVAHFSSLPRSSRITVAIRKRIKKGDRYVARERKRGAILDLFSAMESRDFAGFILLGEVPHGRYAILLDDDSELLPGSIRAAILSMEHPLNAEYDLMTFGGRVNRYSLGSHYSLRFLRSCSVDAYPYYSDFYSDAFDAALYCGKAIVRIAPYLEKLRDFFPDGRVLSHDLIEGAVLRSGSLGRCVYEDAPDTFAADAVRTSRWQRGDVQLLPYAFSDRVRDRKGNRIPNPIAPIYKLILFINGFTVLRDAMLWLVFLFAYFSGEIFLGCYAVSCLLFVKVYALVDSLRTFFTKVRFSHAARGFLRSLELLAEELFLSPYRAVSGVYLFTVTCIKMATRSPSLLEWRPFRTTQGTGGVGVGAELMLPSVIAVSAFAVVAGDLFVSLFALLVCWFDFSLLFSGVDRRRTAVSDALLSEWKEDAKKIYAYFSSLADDGLPTDNLQLFPYEMRSRMTSPTDLGFCLLAEVSAMLLGIASAEEGRARFLSLLDKIETLERWKGHLYNWYDVKTFRVMPPRVVSTVDSANFVACLIVSAEHFRSVGDLALADRLTHLADEANFTALYRSDEKAMAIVFHPEVGSFEGRYDLLASESRLAYYFAIGQGVDPECYFSLGRDCDGACGNTLLSWSGTAFEYMLPRIFLRAPTGSLLREQEFRSGLVQSRDVSEGVFGRSECGHAEFNDSGAYRYKAVGCSRLALSDERSDVVAPYASFLYLPCFPRHATENLRALREKGLEGQYGFYEAIDFDEDRIVRSYMTHHQGMALAALTNALTEDALVRLFSRSALVRAVRLLLAEENVSLRFPRRRDHAVEERQESPSFVSLDPRSTNAALAVRSGDFCAVYDGTGRGRTSCGNILIGKYRPYLPEVGGMFVQIKEDGRLYSPTTFPHAETDRRVVFGDRCVRYEAPAEGVTMSVSPLDGYDGELRKITVENGTDHTRKLTLSAFVDVALNGQDAYDSHPAFSDMFLTAEYDAERNAEYLYRKNAECKISAAASFSVKGLSNVHANCNAYNVIGRGGDARSDFAAGLERGTMPPFGDVLYPCFSFSGTLTVPPHERVDVYFILLAAESVEPLKERNERADLAYRSGAIELIGKGDAAERGDTALYVTVCSRLLFLRSSPDVLASRYEHRVELSTKGIPEELDILYLDLTERFGSELFPSVAVLSERLTRNGIPHALVLVTSAESGAGMSGDDLVRKTLDKVGARAVLVDRAEREIFRSSAKVVFPLISENVCDVDLPVSLHPKDGRGGPILYRTGEGGFTAAGYRVVPRDGVTLLPYANVVGVERGGFVVTERGGGFTFGANAREDKLSVWTGDALRDPRTEEVTLRLGDEVYLLNGDHVEHRIGSTDFVHLVGDLPVRLSLSLAEGGTCKVFEVLFGDDPSEDATLSLSLYFALGWRFDDGVFAEKVDRGFKVISQRGESAYLYCDLDCDLDVPAAKCLPFRFRTIGRLSRGVCRFYLSSEPMDFVGFDLVRSRAETLKQVFRSAITVRTGRFSLDELYDRVLPYQTLSARINARTGFYQCSGAIGFRDQLQDCLAMLYADPDLVRRHILDAAAHQYAEGDVQHWWHPPRCGVRTRISDDRLWLVYLTSRYVETTGVDLILDEPIPFLVSPPLAEGEVSRYEIPSTGEIAPLREHLRRAIRVSLSFGEHDLLLMGSGDWNDGLDRVGVRGRGESVWLSMFACRVIEDSLNFFSAEDRAVFSAARSRLAAALRPLFRGGRYPLAFADDGVWLGYEDTPACSHALNPQSWAVLCGALPDGDAKRALLEARSLVDESAEIVRLSVPPFDSSADYGYVAAYPKGVRENGGQYTHAAVWYVKALLVVGEADEAYRVLRMLDPILRSTDEARSKVYMGEPYVLAGDVYGSEPYRGRVGWTWYTGSAGWLYHVLTEDFFGLKKRGDRLYVDPCLPSCMQEAEAELRLEGRRVSIRFLRADEDALIVNGARAEYIDLGSDREITAIRHFRRTLAIAGKK